MKKSGNENVRVTQHLSQLSDEELVRLARLQLPYVTTAYETLFHRYYKIIIQVCYRYFYSNEEAEEVVNGTMLVVFNKISTFEERASFKTWLFKIAHNLSMTKLRKKKLEQVDIDEICESELQTEPPPNDDYNDELRVLLDKLSLDERAIVMFRISGDLEFTEIANITEQKLSTVKMRYKRALDKMSDMANEG